MRIAPLFGCAAAALCAVVPAAAIPFAAPLGASAVEPARLVCDGWGECWEEPDRRYYARPRYRYDDDDADSGYQRARRPPTKWQRKGFCPPGQHKKGNC
jgi:hypothetical protein